MGYAFLGGIAVILFGLYVKKSIQFKKMRANAEAEKQRMRRYKA